MVRGGCGMCAYMPIKNKAEEDGLAPTLSLRIESETQGCADPSWMLGRKGGVPSCRGNLGVEWDTCSSSVSSVTSPLLSDRGVEDEDRCAVATGLNESLRKYLKRYSFMK